MERYSPDYVDDEPLDLSFKPQTVHSGSGKQVHGESAICLVKTCECNNQPKHFHSEQVAPNSNMDINQEMRSSPLAFDNRKYSAFSVKGRILRDCESYKNKYDLSANQTNTSYHRHSPNTSFSTFMNTDPGPATSSPDHTLHALPPSSQSTTAYSYAINEKPNRFNVGYLSQSVCPTTASNVGGTSLMDFVNDSIEIGLKDKAAETSKRMKREYGETDDESRSSPSGSKRYKPEDKPHVRQFDSQIKITDQIGREEIDVVSMDVSESRGDSPYTGTNSEQDRSQNEANSQVKNNYSNISLPPRKKSGSKVLDINYMISKVLQDRGENPYNSESQPHSIKRIFCGEGKGQIRLVDLIELQVEESLKA